MYSICSNNASEYAQFTLKDEVPESGLVRHGMEVARVDTDLERFGISMNFIDVLANSPTPVHLGFVSVAAALLEP